MEGRIRNVESTTVWKNGIKQATLCQARRLMLLLHAHIMYISLSAEHETWNIPALSNTKPDWWIIQLYATKCCNSPKMQLFVNSITGQGLYSFTGRGPIDNRNIKDRPRCFVNSSSALKCYPLLLNRNAFDLKLETDVFSDDNEYYMETAFRCNSASCPLQLCSVCQPDHKQDRKQK